MKVAPLQSRKQLLSLVFAVDSRDNGEVSVCSTPPASHLKEGRALDLVTTNLVNSFRQQYGFPENVDLPTLFEHFANFCVASKEYSDEFEIGRAHV